MSSPPLATVIPATERNDKCSNLLFCLFVCLRSINLLIQSPIGMNPIKPMKNNGTTKMSNAANAETITSNIMPRNCPMVTLRARRLGVEKSIININVSSILDARKALVPIPRSVENN
jgi:hypothetical protein